MWLCGWFRLFVIWGIRWRHAPLPGRNVDAMWVLCLCHGPSALAQSRTLSLSKGSGDSREVTGEASSGTFAPHLTALHGRQRRLPS